MSRSWKEFDPDPFADMMANPWITLTVLCVGTLMSLPRSQHPAGDLALELPDQTWEVSVRPAQAEPQSQPLQDLSNYPYRHREVRWDAQAPDEDGMASLHAHSTDSLIGMTWILPRGIQALHLREGQAQLIEEPDQWRVVAGDVHRLALHWQQRWPSEAPFN